MKENLLSLDPRFFPDFVKTLRLYSGMTQKDFADALMMPARTLQNWEAGLRNPPDYICEWFWCACKCRLPQVTKAFVLDLQIQDFLYR